MASPLINRFLEKIAIAKGKCWNWTASVDSVGYGKIKHKGKFLKSNRVAYQLLIGEIPNKLLVLHRCDNQRCCNPSHLFLGTQLDNVRDAIAKGRR